MGIKRLIGSKLAYNFCSLVIALLFQTTLLRIIEYIYLILSTSSFQNLIKFQIKGLFYDYFIVLVLSGIIIFPIALILQLIKKRSLKTLLSSFVFAYSLIHLSFIHFFKNAFIPLDSVIFKYGFSEIASISKTSSDISIYVMISAILILSTLITFATKIVYTNINKTRLIFPILVVTIIISLVFIPNIQPRKKHFNSTADYYLSINKTYYFFSDSYNYLYKKPKYSYKDNSEHVKLVEQYWKLNPENIYTDTNYPLLHLDNKKDILSDYFKLTDTPPNFVFIIIEGFGRAISGKNARLGSFTPFLDSLSQHSLSWENFLSNSERTFGVLPNIFGSLPYGMEGFNAMEYEMPTHYSLLKTFNKAGYNSSFFYGGWMGFDNMDKFLERNNVKNFINDFGNYKKTKAQNKNNFSWGYNDLVLFKRAMEIKDSLKTKKPFVDIYLTLSIHSPWKLDNQNIYTNMVDSYINKMDYSENNHLILDQNNKNILSCIMFTDNALRNYFSTISKKDYFKNTIFIITGDHRLHSLHRETDFELYHVPLIIYSPMLKKSHSFKAISSHLNIAPTFSNFLINWNINPPHKNHYLQNELDTSSNFRNRNTIFFMRNNKKIDQVIHGNYLLDDENIYELLPNMKLELTTNQKIQDSLNLILNSFKYVNNYVCSKNKLVPFKEYLTNTDKILIADDSFESLFNNNAQAEVDSINIFSFSKDNSYIQFIPEKLIPNNLSEIEIRLELIIKSDTIKKYPILIDISDNNENMIYESAYIQVDTTFQTTSLIRKIKLNSEKPNKKIKVYLWNDNKNKGYIQDYKLNIFGNN